MKRGARTALPAALEQTNLGRRMWADEYNRSFLSIFPTPAMRLHSLFFCTTLIFCSSPFAHDYTIGKLHVMHPHARATAPRQPSAAVYLTIENQGASADKLLSVKTPAARTGELHVMSMEGNVMKMREVDSIALAPASTVAMTPGGGYHIMLTGLRQALKTGQKIPLALTFEKAGALDVKVTVEAIDAPS